MNKVLENVMQNAIKNNPEVLKLINEVDRSGMTPKDFFFKKAQEMGIDPTEILDDLKLK